MILTFEVGNRRSHEHELYRGDMVSFLQNYSMLARIDHSSCCLDVRHLHFKTMSFGTYSEAISSFPHFESFDFNSRDHDQITQTGTSLWRILQPMCHPYKDWLSDLNVG